MYFRISGFATALEVNTRQKQSFVFLLNKLMWYSDHYVDESSKLLKRNIEAIFLLTDLMKYLPNN